MYEMEGPRLRLTAVVADCSAAVRHETPPRCPWRLIAQPPNAARLGPLRWYADCSAASLCEPAAPLVCRLLRYRLLRGTSACRIPPSVPVARPFLRSLGFPRVEPALVVKNFYCQPSTPHKAFPRELQDSLAVHRTSVVYPLCTVAFHWPVHRLIHRSWGFLSRGRTVTAAARPRRGDPEGCRAVLVLSAQRKVRHDRRPRQPRSPPQPEHRDPGPRQEPRPAAHDHRGRGRDERAGRRRPDLLTGRSGARDDDRPQQHERRGRVRIHEIRIRRLRLWQQLGIV